MPEAKKFRAIKGVRDILPPETALWDWFEQTARRVLEAYNFREIRLPILEQTELFARSVGADTDIVGKEMYTFEGKLEVLRASITDLIADVQHPSLISKFGPYLVVFVDNLRRGLAAGQIAKTPANLTTIEKLEEIANEAIRRYNSGQRAPSPEWDLIFNDVQRLANRISFEESESLRPEGTASMVRAYIEHGLHTLPGLVKLYYVGPMFRRERPQKGRFRQFYQIGAEVLGPTDHPAIDAEIIEMLTVLLGACRIEGWTLLVNSMGCADCRPKYVEKLGRALERVKSRMCGDCQRRAETNPQRVLDCKVEADQPIIEKLPAIIESLDEPCREHFEEFQRQLALRQIPYTIRPRLVRGLDYYMRTTFEITSPVLGAQNALVGGGRYDGLSELLGGPPAKGIGFALGEDRFILAVQEARKVDASRPVDVYVAWIGGAAYPAAVQLARRLRQEWFTVELPPEEMRLKKSLGLADKLGARYALLVGEAEIVSGAYVLRRLSDGEQNKLSEQELVDFLKSEGRQIPRGAS